MALPSAYIGSHQYLTNLLIQGNKLQTLPLELGEKLVAFEIVYFQFENHMMGYLKLFENKFSL